MPERLSERSVTVLSLIAQGQSYGQIVDGHPGITYLDIFKAAEEALQLNGVQSDYTERLNQIKSANPRAYAPWSPEEDRQLTDLHRLGIPPAEIAMELQRQTSAIRARINKLGLALPTAAPGEPRPQD